MRAAAVLGCAMLAGCAAPQAVAPAIGIIAVYQPATGSTPVLEGLIAAGPGHHLVMGDLVATPGMVIPAHRHSGEEFLYVIGGSAVLSREGLPDLLLKAGEGVRIAPGVVHWGKAGEAGTRAISSWIVVNGEPLRTPEP
jgi:quercetin dioxygenase-like cupin family protein